jgi:hypothetical protein
MKAEKVDIPLKNSTRGLDDPTPKVMVNTRHERKSPRSACANLPRVPSGKRLS